LKLVELRRIERAVAKKQKLEEESKSRIKVHAENVKRLEAILAKYDSELEMKPPYWSREDIEQVETLKSGLTAAPQFEGYRQEELYYAQQNLYTSISLAWQTLPLLKEIAVIDQKIMDLDKALSRSFDARVREQVEQVNKLQAEKQKLEELKWSQIQKFGELLGIYERDDLRALNKEIAEKGADSVRTELIELLKPYGSRPRPQTEGDEVG